MFTLGLFAIMVQEPIQVSQQQQCDYSIEVNYKTYKCLSQEEYNAHVESEARKDKEAADVITGFLAKYWWACLGFLAVIFVWSAYNDEQIQNKLIQYM